MSLSFVYQKLFSVTIYILLGNRFAELFKKDTKIRL